MKVKGQGLAMSVNEADNGLLLCGLCHGFFDTKLIGVDSSGKISISEKLNKNDKFKSLRGKDVCWKAFIDKRGWPTKNQLKFAMGYKKRKRSDMVDDINSEEEDEEGDDEVATAAKELKPAAKKSKPAAKKRRQEH